MLPIRWSAQAVDELDAIAAYIARSNPPAAERLLQLIEDAVLPLAEHPYLHRTGRVDGTRELVAHPNYIVVYCVRTDYVEVLGVLHTHREYP